ncbi:MAG: glutamine-hydrolyzing carbamoyl-phosphate synthase small subunit [Crocinitomicaceae bacterium]
MKKKPALLVLADGTVYRGKAVGKIGTTTGEIAFNTGMTGYQEIFTDPSYYRQILIMNTAHIGNYGVHPTESESDSIKISGLVTKKFSPNFSRPAASGSLQDFMEKDGVAGISDVDTRALVRHIRNAGAMNAIISSDDLNEESLKKKLEKVPSMEGLELSSEVTTKEAYTVGDPTADFKVSLLDLGCKRNIINCLVERGCHVKVFPMSASVDEMMEFEPDGFMMSNGPGDPAAMSDTIDKIKDIINTNVPVFGICLGHQLIALSQGLKTEKMHNGHRGINHPIKNLLTGKGEITSQNHGFVVSQSSVDKNKDIELTHIHLNDDSVAGIRMKSKNVFCVQYHPEASAGPHDSRYLFDQFIENMKLVEERQKTVRQKT